MLNIFPQKHGNGIRLRFTVQGRRFSFHPLPGGRWDDKRDQEIVVTILTKVQNDILAGNFDPTLKKYRHKALPDSITIAPVAPKLKEVNWLDLCNAWIKSLCLPVHTAAGHYQALHRQIEKSGNPTLSEVDWLLNSKIATSTFNRRLSMLRSLIQWCREKNLIDFDPLVKVVHRKTIIEEQQKQEENCRPFCHNEIVRIVELFRQKHPTYAPFAEFMFFTGVRSGEAVGLLWRHIDFDKRLI